VTLEIVEADLDRPEHQRDVLAMTQAYASDPMGNGGPLPPEVAERLIPGLRAHPTTLIFLAYLDGQIAGIATCFRGFSTFYALPTINLHDVAVLPEHRGAGIGRRLLEAVAARARALGCCKLTLEVQENNTRARRLYESFGFRQAVYVESAGGGLYYNATP
jgi:ribosomal protein S18 acetylase RimI-like enzyme